MSSIRMFVNNVELEPVEVGIWNNNYDGKDKLIVKFKSDKDLRQAIQPFRELSDDSVIKNQNDKRVNQYVGYCSMDSHIETEINGDGTFNYTVILYKRTALEIAQQAKADVEYIAAMAGIEI